MIDLEIIKLIKINILRKKEYSKIKLISQYIVEKIYLLNAKINVRCYYII